MPPSKVFVFLNVYSRDGSDTCTSNYVGAEWDRKNKDDVPPIDYFMLILSDIPRIKERLQCLLLSSEFEEKYEDVLSNVTTILSATRKMKSSIKVKTIMETILALGNYINGSTSPTANILPVVALVASVAPLLTIAIPA